VLDAFLKRYPEAHRENPRRRIRLRIDREHDAAVFELVLHEALTRSGCVIEEIEPEMRNEQPAGLWGAWSAASASTARPRWRRACPQWMKGRLAGWTRLFAPQPIPFIPREKSVSCTKKAAEWADGSAAELRGNDRRGPVGPRGANAELSTQYNRMRSIYGNDGAQARRLLAIGLCTPQRRDRASAGEAKADFLQLVECAHRQSL